MSDDICPRMGLCNVGIPPRDDRHSQRWLKLFNKRRYTYHDWDMSNWQAITCARNLTRDLGPFLEYVQHYD